jgi:hypothetical protein
MSWGRLLLLLWPAFAAGALAAASKGHAVTFGTATQVDGFVRSSEENSLKLKVRPLYVDGKLEEFTTGDTHDITDRAFVVRKVYRVNDRPPTDAKQTTKWKWQRAGWLLVDRPTGRVTELRLPDFDPFYSSASWYQDYVAYCGVSGDPAKVYGIVAQVGVKKPLVRKELGHAHSTDMPDSECDAWQRQPVRVTFTPKEGQPVTFAIHRSSAEVSPEEPEE